MNLRTIVALFGISIFANAAHAKVETINDVLGRQVEVDVPAKRVILGFYAEDYMAIGTEKAFDNVVGLSLDNWKGSRPANWALYANYRPSLKEIADIGGAEVQSISIEKVLSLKPSVIVLADWQFKGLGTDIALLEDAGIPIVVIDYNAQTLTRHLKSTQIIGLLTGQQKRATQIANEYLHTIESTLQRIAAANLPKPRTYIEFANEGPSQYSFTYGKNMWGAMVTLMGGDNIAAPFVEWWGPMNPEQVLASKPEVVFLTGTESGIKGDALAMGQGIDRQLAAARLRGFKTRPGWAQMPAVQNGRVYGIYQGASRSIADAAMAQFLAKALYPSLFKEVDPEQEYLNFYKKYLPVTPSGTFTVNITE